MLSDVVPCGVRTFLDPVKCGLIYWLRSAQGEAAFHRFARKRDANRGNPDTVWFWISPDYLLCEITAQWLTANHESGGVIVSYPFFGD